MTRRSGSARTPPASSTPSNGGGWPTSSASGDRPGTGRRGAAWVRSASGSMAAYLDDSRIRGRGREWSHLIADSTEELHAFATRLGLEPARFHGNPARPWKDHYDVPEAKRPRAIQLGAR